MSRKTLFTIIAGTLVFLGVLVLYLPASWFASFLPPQVRCAGLGGSVWHGECLSLEIMGQPLGDADWNLSPLKALTGTLSGDVAVQGPSLAASADLDLNFSGLGELRNLKARFPMDPAFLPVFPRDQRGQISVDFKRLVLEANAQPQTLEGTVELRDFRQLRPQALELGSYQLAFDGTRQPNGDSVGLVKDLGGPFIVEGTLRFTPPNGYLVQGFITGRTAQAEQLVREITFGAPPDGSGRAPFTFEGSF